MSSNGKSRVAWQQSALALCPAPGCNGLPGIGSAQVRREPLTLFIAFLFVPLALCDWLYFIYIRVVIKIRIVLVGWWVHRSRGLTVFFFAICPSPLSRREHQCFFPPSARTESPLSYTGAASRRSEITSSLAPPFFPCARRRRRRRRTIKRERPVSYPRIDHDEPNKKNRRDIPGVIRARTQNIEPAINHGTITIEVNLLPDP